jgi:Bacterial PH domain
MPALLPSELPVLARVRHHWIVMLRRPSLAVTIILVFLALAAIVEPVPMIVPFVIVFGVMAFLRWQTWEAEIVILTTRRIVRVRGVPETTTTESSLRLDRISGAVLEQTVLGKLLDYGTIELEAPGNHPEFRRLSKIERPHQFYLQLRHVIFGDGVPLDPDDRPDAMSTEPLPFFPPSSFRRRR